MDDRKKRCVLYGVGGAVLGTLGYLGFLYRAAPELGTLLSAANLQLRLAYGMPATDLLGKPLGARTELLDAAARNLELARDQAGDRAMLLEFEGFLHHLRGEHRAAAACYRLARGLPDCERDQRDVLVFNESRMLAAGGDPAGALAVLRREADSLQPQYAEQRLIEEAALLGRLGRIEEAVANLDRVAQSSQEPMAWLQAGQQYAALGRADAAERTLARAAEVLPIADYDRARLKLASGHVDSCCELLERAAAAVPAEVRRRLREDAEVWRVLATNERFVRLDASSPAAPGR